jgi:hypothetical protein
LPFIWVLVGDSPLQQLFLPCQFIMAVWFPIQRIWSTDLPRVNDLDDRSSWLVTQPAMSPSTLVELNPLLDKLLVFLTQNILGSWVVFLGSLIPLSAKSVPSDSALHLGACGLKLCSRRSRI